MKRFSCCLGGGSSSKVVQEPPEPQAPPQQPQQPQLPQPPEPSEPSDPSEPTDSSESTEDEELANNGVTFRWRKIVEGTENFRITNFLGRGNFGEVYRCDLPRINKVGAAKIHNHDSPSGHFLDFLAEITTLLELDSHPNVIKLLGKSFGRENSAIVYEFLPNGSLDHHLFANSRPGPGLRQETRVLDWDTRMRIAVGVAEALAHLHTGLKTIHGDVQIANILLDEDFAPKLSDFGSAIKIVENADGVERQREVDMAIGAQGYMAPETEDLGLVSTKSDVYSYGVFLFVLFTGRRAYDVARPEATRKITDWLMPVWSREENLRLVADVALGKKFSVEGLNRLFLTARMCIDAQASSRPDMDFVETMVHEAAAYPVSELSPVRKRISI